VALRVIMDSLRYWVEEMRVDGFRFDLAVTTGRGRRAYDRNSAFFTALAQDPVVGTVKLIAEPWDVGEMDSYQVGNFPAPWRELNGRHRDTARRYWRGALGVTASFAKRLCGSQDMFAWDARPPTSSVNLLTSHDGFTLRDLVSYQSKHNLANGEDNRDGDNDNHSSNAGVEGDSDDPVVLSLRRRRARAMLAGLLVARGVPFLTAGDERWRTQLGNNNAYCQDNEISWIDWTPDPEAESLTDFTRRLLAFRRGHPVLRRAAFLGGRIDPSTGLRDVTWLTGGGGLLGHDAWHEDERRCFGMLLDDRPPLLLIFLADPDAELEFTLPGDTGSQWDLVFDSSLEAPFPDHAVTVTGAWKIQGPAVACLRLRDGKLPPVIPA
jgi:isoamylase